MNDEIVDEVSFPISVELDVIGCICTHFYSGVFFIPFGIGSGRLCFFLCLFLLLVVETIHFFRFRKQQKERMHLLQNILLVTEELPAPKSPLEEDYQKMVLRFAMSIRKMKQNFSRNESSAWIIIPLGCIKLKRQYR